MGKWFELMVASSLLRFWWCFLEVVSVTAEFLQSLFWINKSVCTCLCLCPSNFFPETLFLYLQYFVFVLQHARHILVVNRLKVFRKAYLIYWIDWKRDCFGIQLLLNLVTRQQRRLWLCIAIGGLLVEHLHSQGTHQSLFSFLIKPLGEQLPFLVRSHLWWYKSDKTIANIGLCL